MGQTHRDMPAACSLVRKSPGRQAEEQTWECGAFGPDPLHLPLKYTIKVSCCFLPILAEPFVLWSLLTSLTPGQSQTDFSKVWISAGSLHLVSCHSELCPRSQTVPEGSGRGQHVWQHPQLGLSLTRLKRSLGCPDLWPQIPLSRSSVSLSL